jgi:hypothetical protein
MVEYPNSAFVLCLLQAVKVASRLLLIGIRAFGNSRSPVPTRQPNPASGHLVHPRDGDSRKGKPASVCLRIAYTLALAAAQRI